MLLDVLETYLKLVYFAVELPFNASLHHPTNNCGTHVYVHRAFMLTAHKVLQACFPIATSKAGKIRTVCEKPQF